jgi:hypothetical protein
MRRPWIKIEICTPDKPEVCSLATQLRMDSDAVVGKLVRLWSWAELNRIDPNDFGVTKEFIDKLVGRKGFAQALEKTGWLIETDEKLSFRNFKRHNSPVAQNKALTAKRVARHRLRKAKVQEKDTIKTLPDTTTEPSHREAPEAVKNTKKRKLVTHEKVTENPMPEPVVEEPSAAEVPDFQNAVSDVITPVSSLEINVEDVYRAEPESADSVLPAEEPITVVTEEEALPQITPQEALAVLQLEEPTPRKRRSKAAAEADDQPMLF